MRLTCASIMMAMITLLMLCSCSDNNGKETAYCFSAVFENGDGVSNITLYCKIPTSDNGEGEEEESVVLSFDGDSFYGAFEAINESEYEIYFGSLCAIYFSENVTASQLSDVAAVIFGNTGYNTSCSVYSQNPGTIPPTEILHSFAADTCDRESISNLSRKYYKKAIDYFRTMLCKEGKNEEQA